MNSVGSFMRNDKLTIYGISYGCKLICLFKIGAQNMCRSKWRKGKENLLKPKSNGQLEQIRNERKKSIIFSPNSTNLIHRL